MSVLSRLYRFVLLFTLASAMPFGTAGAEDRSRPSAAEPSPRAQTSQTPLPGRKPTEERSFITFKDGRLDVRIENRSLQWALARISRQSGVPIFSVSGLGVEPLSSVQFEKLSLEEGLRRLLKGHDVFFFVGGDEKTPDALRAVWIYPQGHGRGLMPLAPETGLNAHDLADPNPDTRARALEVLAERQGQQSLPAVLQALNDPEQSVRSRALYMALNSAVVLPQDALEHLVRNDSSPLVRFLAMEAITNFSLQDPSAARAIAEFALRDADPQVRAQAQLILQMASQPQEVVEPTQGQGRDAAR